MRLFVIILLTITCALGYSQEITRKGFFNKTKVALLVRLKTEPELNTTSQFNKMRNGTEITTINGWYINSKFGVGLGVSSTSYVNPTLTFYPVFANFHYYFIDKVKTPFIFGNVGYNIEFKEFYKGGLLYEAGLGYNFKLSKNTALTTDFAYKYQDFGFEFFTDQKASLQSLSLGIGFLF